MRKKQPSSQPEVERVQTASKNDLIRWASESKTKARGQIRILISLHAIKTRYC